MGNLKTFDGGIIHSKKNENQDGSALVNELHPRLKDLSWSAKVNIVRRSLSLYLT